MEAFSSSPSRSRLSRKRQPSIRVPTQPAAQVRFGPFELYLSARELRKHGVRLKLYDQPFEVLALLIARPGELITREEIRQQLWPQGTFVDFENGLNRAVNRLRDALGDSADEPKFIETIPRHGYRFISPIESVKTVPASFEEPPPLQMRQSNLRRWFATVAAVAAILVAGFVGWHFYSSPCRSSRLVHRCG